MEYRVKGALFENTKNKGNGPLYTGFVEIDGVKTNISLWAKRSAKGDDYIQISEDRKLESKASSRPPAPPTRVPQTNSPFKQRGNDPRDDMYEETGPRPEDRRRLDLDDDIPF
jgi:hypothetical protein